MIFKKIDLYMHLYIIYEEPLQRNAHLSLLRERERGGEQYASKMMLEYKYMKPNIPIMWH